MKKVFIDTAYFIAILDLTDQLHPRALEAAESLEQASFFTSDAVLIEVLNYFSKSRRQLRIPAAQRVKAVLSNSAIDTVYHGRAFLARGLEFYQSRQDKDYSLTDCISMLIMRDRGILEILTDDKHFRQEGFTTLI